MTDKQMKGIGGAPTRATTLPTTSQGRKECPVASGVLDYFPDALAHIARVSFLANEQHNAGQPMHWARTKSTDEADALMRHFLQRGLDDEDGLPHSAKMAWRALALLQKEVENRKQEPHLVFTEVKDGPYCWNCEGLAERRSRTGNCFCEACLDKLFNGHWSDDYFTVLEPFGKRKDYQR